MFKVKAIENKEEQKRLCDACGTEYAEKAFAYAAYDIKSADDECGEVIGVCQFTISGTPAMLCLSPANGRESDEAMLILGFAVLEFLRRCRFEAVVATIPESYATRLGFRKTEDGLTLDLTAGRACGGH